MKPLILCALLALGAVPLAAHAGSDLSKLATMKNPGEWQVTATRKMEIPGTKMVIPPKTVTKKKCVTKKDLDKLSHFTPQKVQGMTCKLGKKNLSGNTFTFSVNCDGKSGHLKMNGKTVFQTKNASRTHVDMSGKMNNMPMHLTLDATSKRIGECTAPSSGK
jgi:hypothetical protein